MHRPLGMIMYGAIRVDNVSRSVYMVSHLYDDWPMGYDSAYRFCFRRLLGQLKKRTIPPRTLPLIRLSNISTTHDDTGCIVRICI